MNNNNNDKFIINTLNYNGKEFHYFYDNKKEAQERCKEMTRNVLIYKIYLSEVSDIYKGLYDEKEQLIEKNRGKK